MSFQRYQIPTENTPNIAEHPRRFNVRVSRIGLARLLIGEIFHQRGDMAVVTSRPCIYGVFSGPIGGFAPQPHLCVGCLRCTVEYPKMVQVEPNRKRFELGDHYFDPEKVDTVLYESTTGHIPVRGAGYRGKLGGRGWDTIWTDMSEIVRPTRDGIHGREYISTSVDIGYKPRFLEFHSDGTLKGEGTKTISLPIPFIIDRMPESVESPHLYRTILRAAEAIQSRAILPLNWLLGMEVNSPAVIPLVSFDQIRDFHQLSHDFDMIELEGWDANAYRELVTRHLDALIAVRIPFEEDFTPAIEAGVSVLHLTASYHGETGRGFVLNSIKNIHRSLLERGIRESVTILGSGGMILAEHLPKSMICGLDLVAIDTPILIALQARFLGEVTSIHAARMVLPQFDIAWGAQRIQNLAASWRDQLLEILGAMGLREVRRLRGEIGRAMFLEDLEREAFASIDGFGK
jgi:hypothetical protein